MGKENATYLNGKMLIFSEEAKIMKISSMFAIYKDSVYIYIYILNIIYTYIFYIYISLIIIWLKKIVLKFEI